MNKSYEFNGHVFDCSDELGGVLKIVPKGKKVLIIREFGIEKLHPAIDPSKYRIEIVYKSPLKILNLKQIKYRIKRRDANVRSISLFERGTSTAS